MQKARLRCWAQKLTTELDQQLYQPLRDADRGYRLRGLGRGAHHDWGGVQNQFHELVMIHRHTRRLHLAVAADD